MAASNEQNTSRCSHEEIHVYLDGELSREAARALEEHLDACGECRSEFERQAAISTHLSAIGSPELPPDFAKVVATRAESDVGSVRSKREITIAIVLSACLVIVASLIFGVEISAVQTALSGIYVKTVSLAAFLLKGFGDLSYGATIVIRAFLGVVGPVSALLALLILLTLGVTAYYFRNKIRSFFVIPASHQ